MLACTTLKMMRSYWWRNGFPMPAEQSRGRAGRGEKHENAFSPFVFFCFGSSDQTENTEQQNTTAVRIFNGGGEPNFRFLLLDRSPTPVSLALVKGPHSRSTLEAGMEGSDAPIERSEG